MKKRFLRDGVLDEMLDDICQISEKVPENEQALLCSQSFASLLELYETNKVVLQYLEEAIDDYRSGGAMDGVIEKVVQAAAHIQIGCVSAHDALQTFINEKGIIRSE